MTDLINKIPAQKTGTEFLVASHFTISHEDRWAPSKDPLVYKSTFKKDYPPLPLTKRERIPSPSPATIMHKDDRYNDKCSMTRGHFVGKNPEKQNYANSTSTLTKTNFKMDSDRQLKSFQTTHKEYYPVRPLDEARNPAATGKKDWMRSYIPQGMLFLLPGQLINILLSLYSISLVWSFHPGISTRLSWFDSTIKNFHILCFQSNL